MMIIHGCAMPFHEWIEPDASDPSSWMPFRVRPGAFAAVLEQPDLVSDLKIDHLHDWSLASVRDGTLRLWEERRGLMWEADLEPQSRLFDAGVSGGQLNPAKRAYGRVKNGEIVHCCIAMTIVCDGLSRETHPGFGIEITGVKGIGNLGLCDYLRPHCPTTFIRTGAAPPVSALPPLPRHPNGSMRLVCRTVEEARALE
jgi:hypothetical protein